LKVDWLEPNFPSAEQLEASAKRARESVALWMWNDDWYENNLIWQQVIAEVKEERAKAGLRVL
jgi:hypothetical protein